MLIRKSKLGKVLYESYCAAHDPESLQDWYQQEDDYASLALLQVICKSILNMMEFILTWKVFCFDNDRIRHMFLALYPHFQMLSQFFLC